MVYSSGTALSLFLDYHIVSYLDRTAAAVAEVVVVLVVGFVVVVEVVVV